MTASSRRELASRAPLVTLGLVAIVVAALGTPAHAGSRAWAAARKVLPPGLQVVAGIDAGAIRSSQSYAKLMPLLMARAGDDAKAPLEAIHATCHLDPRQVIDSLVMGLDADKHGVMVLALTGVTRPKVERCLRALAGHDHQTITIAKQGPFTRYHGVGDKHGDKQLYVRWLGRDTLAIATEPGDKGLLAKMTAGGVLHDRALHAALAGLKTGAAVWFVVHQPQEVPGLGAKMTVGYGAIDVAKGQVAGNVHLVLDSATAAAGAAMKTAQGLAMAKQSGQIPPAYLGLVSSLSVTSAGNEVVVSARMAETDLLNLLHTFGVLP